MKFWEDFFSTDKIIYPATGAFLAGFLLCLTTIFINIAITDFLIVIIMIAGFTIGNIIKANKIQEQRHAAEKAEKIKKKKSRNAAP